MGIGIKELEGRLYSRYFTGVLLINCYIFELSIAHPSMLKWLSNSSKKKYDYN